MKNVLTILFLSAIISVSFAETTETDTQPKYKKVCKDVKKNNKTVQECKTIRVHKKLDGTKVPEKQRK
jgi:uncharacterized protein YxeA